MFQEVNLHKVDKVYAGKERSLKRVSGEVSRKITTSHLCAQHGEKRETHVVERTTLPWCVVLSHRNGGYP